MDQPTQTTTTPARPSSTAAVAKILVMILENAGAHASHQPKPHTVNSLNAVRAYLLQDPFFDPGHQREELAPRTKAPIMLFTDMVVLLAKLIRVFQRDGNDRLDEEDLAERINVRNACLDQPFFNHARINTPRPFARDESDGEGSLLHRGSL